MKIKGLAWGMALLAPLALRSGSLQANEIELTNMMGGDCCEADCCETDCCDACDCGDGCGCFAPFWFAQTEMTFMGVDSSTRGSAGLTLDTAATAGIEVVGASDGGYDDFTYAPRIVLGRQLSEDWAVAGRFWYLSDFDSETQVPSVAAPIALGADSRIKMYTTDLEVIRSGQRGDWKLDGSAGVRHASLDVASSLSAAALFPAASFAQSNSSSSSSFDGTGLTSALVGRRQLGDSNAHLFASARGSILWGDAQAAATASSVAFDGGGVALDTQGAIGEGSTEMSIAEFQIGIQWEYKLRRLPASAFFRTAFEYQYWDVDGDGSATVASAAIAPGTIASGAANAGGAEVDLYGLAIGTGFTW